MAWTQTDIDALDAAYASGARKVTSADGKSVEFQSIADYIRLRKLMLVEVAGASRTPSSFSVGRITR